MPARRPLQVALAEFLHGKIADQVASMSEAGTGTGKSYAYLLPAIAAAAKGHRVVISTAMKSLQQQLYFKDLPRLTALNPANSHDPIPFARQLGKTNYACKRRVSLQVFDPKEERVYDEFFDTVKHWVWEDAPEELAAQLPRDRWKNSVGYCSNARCDFYDECSEKGYLAAKDDYMTARIIVANHALVGADMRVFYQHDKKLLGDYTVLIVDEAHKFPEAIRNALACQMSARYFDNAFAEYQQLQRAYSTDPTRLVLTKPLTVPAILPDAAEILSTYRNMFRETTRTGEFGGYAATFAETARKASLALKEMYDLGTAEYTAFLLNGRNPTPKIPDEMRQCETFMQVLYFLDAYASKIAEYANAIDLAVSEKLRYVVSIGEDSKGMPEIVTIPIDVGDRLTDYYSKRDITPHYLSATLTVNGKFDYYAEELGFELDTQNTHLCGSAFDYKKQAWCYIPTPDVVPEPTRPDYMEKAAALSYDLLMANEGHAFILFTSYRDMEAMAAGLKQLQYPYPLLIQGPELKARGREIFLSTPNATLLGTKTFWEGIDIPGLHLSLVIIPKVPFPNPSDAVIKAKSAIAGDAWFRTVSMPAMLTDLRQQAGRLIRTVDDKGVVAVLDSRVHTKSYGKQIVNAVGFPWNSKKDTAIRLLGQLTNLRKKQ